VILTWIGALAGLAVLAFLIGRAGDEGAFSSPTPGPTTGPLPISFGTGIDESSHLVTGPTDSFSPGDTFAYSVDPPAPPGVAQVYVEVSRIDSEVETVVQQATAQALRPGATSFGFAVEATPLIVNWGEGRYAMKIYLDPFGEVYAQGRFILVEPTLPQ
jgi:hypothetical protein